jgi:hypothetical protein
MYLQKFTLTLVKRSSLYFLTVVSLWGPVALKVLSLLSL